MDNRLVIIPGAPLLVEELSGADDRARQLREQVVDCLREVVGSASGTQGIHLVGLRDSRWRTGLTGSLGAWGADIHVGGGSYLPELVGRWLLGRAGVTAPVNARPDLPSKRQVDGAPVGHRFVVVAEGTAGLTPSAPLAEVEHAAALEAAVEGIAGGDRETTSRCAADLAAFGPAQWERSGLYTGPLWMELAAQRPRAKDLLLHETTFGVGYLLARWSW